MKTDPFIASVTGGGIPPANDIRRTAVDKIIKTKWPDGTHRGWKCCYCDSENTSITFTVEHMVRAHFNELMV